MTDQTVRVLVITSCTDAKLVKSPKALRLSDFRCGVEHVRKREAEMANLLRPAERLYIGQHHVRLMRGVNAFRSAYSANSKVTLDLRILSAGYGLVPSSQKLAPYDVTFKTMSKCERQEWGNTLGVPAAFRKAVADPYDIALVLLGSDYLDACLLSSFVKLGGPTLLFSGRHAVMSLPKLSNLRAIAIAQPEAKRFMCQNNYLKGELAKRILLRMATDVTFGSMLFAANDVLTLIESPAVPLLSHRSPAS